MSKIKYFSFLSEGSNNVVLFVDDISRFIFDENDNSLYVKTKGGGDVIPIFLKDDQKILGVSNIVDRILYFLSLEFKKDEDDRSDELDLDMVVDSLRLDEDCKKVRVNRFSFVREGGSVDNPEIVSVESIERFVGGLNGDNKLYLKLKNIEDLIPIFIEDKNKDINVSDIIDKIQYYLKLEFYKKENPSQTLHVDFAIDGLIVDNWFEEVK